MKPGCVGFAITAWNPMAQQTDPDLNQSRNSELESLLSTNSNVDSWCRSMGFDLHGWLEPGFFVTFHDAAAGFAWITELAKRFGQGGIYEYTPQSVDGKQWRLTRRTVPVLINDVDAVVEVVVVPDPRQK
jgi:Protein of unknown function (DUF3293)